MGYVKNVETGYKVGDIISGKNSIKVKVTAVLGDGSINIQLINPHPGTAYYYFDTNVRTARGEADKWLKMPADNTLKNINQCTKVMFKVEHNTKQVKTCNSISWWGNLSGKILYYGCSPHGQYNIPGDQYQTVPEKTLNNKNGNYGLDSSWTYVEGSYKWSANQRNDYYGWRKEINTLHVRNHYARRFEMQFSKGNNTLIESNWITLNKIKLTTSTYVAEPIYAYTYRTPLKANTDVTYNKLSASKFSGYKQLSPSPTVNKFAVPDSGNNNTLNFVWTSPEDADETKFVYSDINVKYTNAYGGKVTNFTVKGAALTGALTDVVMLNDDTPTVENTDMENSRLVGRYEFTIKGTFDGKSNQTTTQSYIIEVSDNGDAIAPVIVDKTDNRIIYDMNKDISTLAHTPTWALKPEHTYTATYDYYAFEGDGYEVVQKEAGVEFKNGEKIFQADGQYYITVTAKYRNGKTKSTSAFFLIDNRPPKAPIVTINGKDQYQGKFLKAEKDKPIYLNSAIATIKGADYTRTSIDIYFKKFKFNEWEHVGKDRLPSGGIFNRIGTWKIVAFAEKTEVTYPDGKPIRSENTEVIFAVKKKLTHKIKTTSYTVERTLGKDIDSNDYVVAYQPVEAKDEGNVKAYKVEALIEFTDLDLWDTGNMDMRYILDDNGNKILDSNGDYKMSIDYHGIDISSKLYRINGKTWNHYLDKIIIYENCKLECKSVDDDGFESYITAVDIKVIDVNGKPDTLKIKSLEDLKEDAADNTMIINTSFVLKL